MAGSIVIFWSSVRKFPIAYVRMSRCCGYSIFHLKTLSWLVVR